MSDKSFELVMKTLQPNAAAITERCQQRKISHAKYGAQLGTFAPKLNFYVTKAYEYVRSCFANGLLSSIVRDGSSVLMEESLSTLKTKVAEQEALQRRLYICALVMDEMAIRKKVEGVANSIHSNIGRLKAELSYTNSWPLPYTQLVASYKQGYGMLDS